MAKQYKWITVPYTWLNNPYKWSDGPIIAKLKRGGSRGGLEKFRELSIEEQKRVIQLICIIKFEGRPFPHIIKDSQVVDDDKNVDVKITSDDINKLIEHFEKNFIKVDISNIK